MLVVIIIKGASWSFLVNKYIYVFSVFLTKNPLCVFLRPKKVLNAYPSNSNFESILKFAFW